MFDDILKKLNDCLNGLPEDYMQMDLDIIESVFLKAIQNEAHEYFKQEVRKLCNRARAS